jgi:uncharacterized membrane protein (TIGR02234 family)
VTGGAIARRELAVAVGLTVAGAVLLLLAGGQPWVRVVLTPPPPLPVQTDVVAGRALAPAVPAVGLVGLATVAALAATRGAWRRPVGGVLFIAGLAAALVSGFAATADEAAVLARAADTRTGTVGTVALVRTPWPAAAVAGGLLLTAAGAFAVVRGARWPGLGGRHDRMTRPPDPQWDLWDALDRGEDPTA